jgi:hypothetical protein
VALLRVARVVLSRVINTVAFFVVLVIGVSAGCALAVADDVDKEIKKRIGTHRPL